VALFGGFVRFALVGVWLAGETESGRAARRKIAEPLARPELALGAVPGFVVLLVWWGRTPQAHRWSLVLAAIVILAVGVEVPRRQSARELAATSESSAPPPPS
jgi:hypothetical protein